MRSVATMKVRCAAALVAIVVACGACEKSTRVVEKSVGNGKSDRVVVVINERSAASEEIGQYYMQKRGILPTHVVRIDVSTTDEMSELEFRVKLVEPVMKAIEALPVRTDFIVLTKGIPIRLESKNGYSVDGHLAAINLPMPPMAGLDTVWLKRYRNPYFAAREHFSSAKYNMYLVTRLDCGAMVDCKSLVDNSIAAKPVRGPFFFDAGPRASGGDGWMPVNLMLFAAAARLTAIGADASIDSSDKFVSPPATLMGYASWGSNDAHFDAEAYHAMRFLPGALAETFVSTSARTFGPAVGGQSRIVDLIAQGVTGVKGYVSEPYTIAMANPEILFDRYLQGFTLAEAFYASSRMVLWKDIFIGDPLCAPYVQEH